VSFSRRSRDLGKRVLFRLFRLGQRLGVDVLPHHFYSSIPDIKQLTASDEWRAPSPMPGVAGTDIDAQLDEARSWFTPDVSMALKETDVHADACRENGADGYGPMEAQFLHAFVATRKPRRIVQVGAGVSTAVILAAAKRHDVDVEVVAIDPFPTPLLERLAAEGSITLLRSPAQTVALETFTSLGDGDLLFVDSTHTVKVGSEVNRLILEVFPQLGPGVTIHVHDIMFPYDYQPDTLDGRLFFWDESTLLHAFLIDNRHAGILLSQSMLGHAKRAELGELLVGYRPMPTRDGLFDGVRAGQHFPSATYLLTS
jgi:predicted O-methyltransferase YrrM